MESCIKFTGLLVFIVVGSILIQTVNSSRHKRQRPLVGGSDRRCQYRRVYYSVGQQFSFQVQNKRFDCTCMHGGRLDCSWTHVTPPAGTKCVDKVTGQKKNEGERWERIQDRKTFDCDCKRASIGMQVICTDENRCHHDGVSYKEGAVFETNRVSGRKMRCTCLPMKKLSCKYEEEVPGNETESTWVENYVVYGGRIVRPQITTIQACRTGSKVMTNGEKWNHTTTTPLGLKIQEECACIGAIIKCQTIRVLDQIEPVCVSSDGRIRNLGQKWLKVRKHFPSQQYECTCRAHDDVNCRRVIRPRCVDDVDGTIRVAGETWIRYHETLENLQFECTCHTNTETTCEDISVCTEPSAPENGALMCALIGRDGPKQVTYCKPMCLSDYEFVNPQRYYRIWEVCGAMNLHRWSGGYADDPNAIARCREPVCVSSDGRIRNLGQKWLKVRKHFPSQQYECTCRAHDDVNCRRVIRPRCVDDVDGTIRIAGETWIRYHETLENLQFECTCHTNTDTTCEDISVCTEPSAPENGALMCAFIGRDGPKQVTYCKPMCLSDYEFVNPQRYYRIWEVCGAMNLHRWSGGYADDPNAIARCRGRQGHRRRGHSNLYLPNNDCESMTIRQREELKALFLRQLDYRSLCREKCHVTLLKCGTMS